MHDKLSNCLRRSPASLLPVLVRRFSSSSHSQYLLWLSRESVLISSSNFQCCWWQNLCDSDLVSVFDLFLLDQSSVYWGYILVLSIDFGSNYQLYVCKKPSEPIFVIPFSRLFLFLFLFSTLFGFHCETTPPSCYYLSTKQWLCVELSCG